MLEGNGACLVASSSGGLARWERSDPSQLVGGLAAEALGACLVLGEEGAQLGHLLDGEHAADLVHVLEEGRRDRFALDDAFGRELSVGDAAVDGAGLALDEHGVFELVDELGDVALGEAELLGHLAQGPAVVFGQVQEDEEMVLGPRQAEALGAEVVREGVLDSEKRACEREVGRDGVAVDGRAAFGVLKYGFEDAESLARRFVRGRCVAAS